MSEEQSGTGQEEGDPANIGKMVGVYRRYFGEPETRRDVYLGFGLFFAGLAVGAIGLVLFLYSGTQQIGSDLFWQFRGISIISAMLALPAIAVSVAVLLPVGLRTKGASIAGSVICIVAIGWFVSVYPFEWTDAGNDITVIGIYAAGLALLAASTGSALVAQYIDRISGSERGGATDDTVEAEGETVSDQQVATDIEEALSDSNLTWGGIEQEPTTRRLKLNLPETDLEQPNVGGPSERRSGSDDVDSAVAGLRQLQGNDQKTARAESPDEQVSALTEFRRERQEEALETGVDDEEGFFTRVRKKFSL